MTGPAPSDGVRAEWAYSDWVPVESGHASVQRQVASPADLAAVIAEIEQLPWDGATRIAERLWRMRPRDAGVRMARGRQSLVAATGLSATMLIVVLAAVVLAYVLLVAVVR